MPRYSAFISYGHAERRFAARLQRKLENFRIPRPTVTRMGLESGRVGTVFRDVADLGAATELSGALKDALADSAALIVVCSPDAVRSQWVGQEIEEFRRIHGRSAPILSIIPPDAGEADAETLFHAALGEAPPLAADARKAADGQRIALLKIVAGLLGTGLDELVQRDARRRQGRLIAGLSVTALIAVVMTILTVFAVSAREDARRRLSQSEDLIGFMLDDLRAQLVPLGQVGIMKSVGDKALAYFESLDDSDLTEAALLRKSRALYQIGDVYFELGEFAAARDSFQLSLDQARLLAAAEPDNTDRLFELSQAEFWVGYAAWYAGDLDAAEKHLVAYHDAAWELHAIEPENPDWVMETFWASNNLGSLAFRRGSFEEALQHFDEAIARINLLIEQEATPVRRYERASTLSWLGSTYYRKGELVSSVGAFRQALDEPLDPDNALHREERAYVLGKLAAVELHLGALDPAREHAQAAVDIATDLAASDPESMELLYTRTAQQLVLAQIDFHEGAPFDYQALVETSQILLAADNPPPKWHGLALDVAGIGVRADEAGAVDWAMQLLERGGSPSVRGETRPILELLTNLNGIDRYSIDRLVEFLIEAESRFHETRDFDLALPLFRTYRLLGNEPGADEMRAVLSRAGSHHPDLGK